eukprot:313841_1
MSTANFPNVSEILRILFKGEVLNDKELLKLHCVFNYIGRTVTKWILFCGDYQRKIKDMQKQETSKKLLLIISRCVLTKDFTDDILSLLAENESYLLLEWQDGEVEEAIKNCFTAFWSCLVVIDSVTTLTFKFIWLIQNDGGAGVGVNQVRVLTTRILACLIFEIQVMETL